jgi:hypothetical protein
MVKIGDFTYKSLLEAILRSRGLRVEGEPKGWVSHRYKQPAASVMWALSILFLSLVYFPASFFLYNIQPFTFKGFSTVVNYYNISNFFISSEFEAEVTYVIVAKFLLKLGSISVQSFLKLRLGLLASYFTGK